MEISIQKWGNSLALRIPKALAKGARLTQGTKAELRLSRGMLVVAPIAAKPWPLKKLLAGVTRENLHGEITAGKPVGREIW